ncbi:iron-sulfur cluster biosynthesis family protein [Sporolactobacillus sp. THM7-7]|nr:iron-sulfur cluster biosynthesis family protein [Sporolactobacillus sp. THM7-7]
MDIQWTATALEKARNIESAHRPGYFRLVMDMSGCGCSEGGIVHLEYSGRRADGEREVGTNGPSVYVEPSDVVYYDQTMIIDYSEKQRTFQLKSRCQWLNPMMRCVIPHRNSTDRAMRAKENAYEYRSFTGY